MKASKPEPTILLDKKLPLELITPTEFSFEHIHKNIDQSQILAKT